MTFIGCASGLLYWIFPIGWISSPRSQSKHFKYKVMEEHLKCGITVYHICRKWRKFPFYFYVEKNIEDFKTCAKKLKSYFKQDDKVQEHKKKWIDEEEITERLL
jgi:hypothetical protein